MISRSGKNANLLLQSFLRLKKARHSHIAITLYGFNVIHAMPRLGVHMQSLGSFLQENRNFIVYRNKLAMQEANAVVLADHLQHHNLQGYSLLNSVFTSWRHSFCSELAAKAYRNAGLRLTNSDKKSNSVLPIDIYMHVSVDADWIDVTDLYKNFFLDGQHSEFMEKLAEFSRKNVQFTQSMGYGQQKLVNRLNTVATRRGEKMALITPPMNFWTNKLANTHRVIFTLYHWARMAKEIAQHVWRLACKLRKK